MASSGVSDGALAYRVLGDGESPTLVIPGGPLLDPQYLGDFGGLSERLPLAVPTFPRVRAEEVVPVLEAVLNTLGLDQVDVIAHSAGAVAALYALRHWPERVRRLVLITPAVGAAGVPTDQKGVDELLARRSSETGFAEALEAQQQGRRSAEAQRVSFGAWGSEQRRLAEMSVHQRQERMNAYYAEPRPDPAVLQAAARGFDRPVTVLHGELDPHPTRTQAGRLAAFFPRSEVVTIRGAGHYPWLDSPHDFVATVLRSFH
ncbi:alpha/beta fold hydrolase [Nesterenkonia muleiensis]|uniref:alpha/beta fold hydrolase n=1 Tax=Nesterenkonia muleiensis TaxID=2282648 RepID=UPI001300B2EB|nr:alpha/beta hydrolase [Nesterenkonia muleiensis]